MVLPGGRGFGLSLHCPVCGLGFSLVGLPVGLFVGPGLIFSVPWLPMPGQWAGFGLSLLCPGCRLGFLLMVCLLSCLWGLGWLMVVLSV